MQSLCDVKLGMNLEEWVLLSSPTHLIFVSFIFEATCF